MDSKPPYTLKYRHKLKLILPSQTEAETTLDLLKDLSSEGIKQGEQFLERPSSEMLGALALLNEIGLCKAPNYFCGEQTSKEFFSYIERNNQIAEEELRILVTKDGFLEEVENQIKTYCCPLMIPDELELKAKPSIDPILSDGEVDCPSAFCWSWGLINLLILPAQADPNKTIHLALELIESGRTPAACLVMPYRNSPLNDIDPYYGSELWYTLGTNPLPLSWQERKCLLNMVKDEDMEDNQNYTPKKLEITLG
jgi:hypothetical protein